MTKSTRKKPTSNKPVARTRAAPKQPPAVATTSADEAAGFEASYEATQADAQAVAESDVFTYTGNAHVALQNARKGVAAVVAERARIESDPKAPKVDFASIAATVRVAEALVFAVTIVSNTSAEKREINALMSEVYETRDEILANAVSLVKSKVITGKDAEVVANIAKGTGPVDAAQDCIALAALYRRIASSIAGKTPITAERVKRAAELGSEALATLTPSGVEVKRDANDPVARAAEMRDRIAVVLTRHYDEIARIGGWLWGFDLAAHVPPLRSRTAAREEPVVTPSPAPAPPA